MKKQWFYLGKGAILGPQAVASVHALGLERFLSEFLMQEQYWSLVGQLAGRLAGRLVGWLVTLSPWF